MRANAKANPIDVFGSPDDGEWLPATAHALLGVHKEGETVAVAHHDGWRFAKVGTIKTIGGEIVELALILEIGGGTLAVEPSTIKRAIMVRAPGKKKGSR